MGTLRSAPSCPLLLPPAPSCSLLLPSLLTCTAVRLLRAAEPRGLVTSRAHVAGPWWGWGRWCPRGRAVSSGSACPQPAGAAAAALPTPEGAGAGREAGGDAAHLLPLLPVPRHAELPARHAQGGERGSGRGARGLRCRGRVAPRSPRLGAGARARRVPRQREGSWVPCSFQLLASMSQCLSLDPLSFSVWRQLYTKHLSQSRWVPAACGAPAHWAGSEPPRAHARLAAGCRDAGARCQPALGSCWRAGQSQPAAGCPLPNLPRLIRGSCRAHGTAARGCWGTFQAVPCSRSTAKWSTGCEAWPL